MGADQPQTSPRTPAPGTLIGDPEYRLLRERPEDSDDEHTVDFFERAIVIFGMLAIAHDQSPSASQMSADSSSRKILYSNPLRCRDDASTFVRPKSMSPSTT